MSILRIKVIYPGRNLSNRNQEHKVYPYQVWSTDITYIRLQRGWMYLVVIVDWATRTVLSWRVSNTCDRSDQGATFTSPDFTKPLLDLGVKKGLYWPIHRQIQYRNTTLGLRWKAANEDLHLKS